MFIFTFLHFLFFIYFPISLSFSHFSFSTFKLPPFSFCNWCCNGQFIYFHSIIPTPAPLPNNGSCIKYNGTVCSRMLRGALVYVRSYEKIENIEKEVNHAYSEIQGFKEISAHCRPYVQPLLCHYKFPSCDTASSEPKARQICYEDCEIVRTKICAKESKIVQRQDLEIVLFPVCASLPRSGTEEGKNCIKLGIKAVQKPEKTPIREGW